MLRLAVVVPALLALGFPIFELGECTLGLNNPGGCALMPDVIGMFAFVAAISAYVIGLYVSPILVLAALVMEVIARRRAG